MYVLAVHQLKLLLRGCIDMFMAYNVQHTMCIVRSYSMYNNIMIHVKVVLWVSRVYGYCTLSVV